MKKPFAISILKKNYICGQDHYTHSYNRVDPEIEL